MSTPTKKIRVAVVGVGNCAKSLIEGVALYSNTKQVDGLAFASVGGYLPSHIQFALAYDVDSRKGGKAPTSLPHHLHPTLYPTLPPRPPVLLLGSLCFAALPPAIDIHCQPRTSLTPSPLRAQWAAPSRRPSTASPTAPWIS